MRWTRGEDVDVYTVAACCGFDLCHKYILYLYLYLYSQMNKRGIQHMSSTIGEQCAQHKFQVSLQLLSCPRGRMATGARAGATVHSLSAHVESPPTSHLDLDSRTSIRAQIHLDFARKRTLSLSAHF